MPEAGGGGGAVPLGDRSGGGQQAQVVRGESVGEAGWLAQAAGGVQAQRRWVNLRRLGCQVHRLIATPRFLPPLFARSLQLSNRGRIAVHSGVTLSKCHYIAYPVNLPVSSNVACFSPLGLILNISCVMCSVVGVPLTKVSHHPPTGKRAVPTDDPVVQEAAEHAVRMLQQSSNSLATYELSEIVSAEAEVDCLSPISAFLSRAFEHPLDSPSENFTLPIVLV